MKIYIYSLIMCGALLGACTTTGQKPTSSQIVEATKHSVPILGQAVPLVCSTPVWAEGQLKNRPNMQSMWEHFIYNKPEGVWNEIGGMVKVNGNLPYDQGRWTNACAVRLSYMLNKAGHIIPDNGNKTVSGKDYDQYYYRVTDIENYLKEAFGAPDMAIEDGSANSYDLPKEPGIVLMDFPDSSFTGHITIWNGDSTVDASNIGGYRVLFWKLPCFIPQNRDTLLAAAKASAPKT